MFFLIESLFSANSASGKSHWDIWILFAGFFDTTDSSAPHTLSSWQFGCLPSRGAPFAYHRGEGYGVSQFLRWKLRCVLRVCDRASLPVNSP